MGEFLAVVVGAPLLLALMYTCHFFLENSGMDRLRSRRYVKKLRARLDPLAIALGAKVEQSEGNTVNVHYAFSDGNFVVLSAWVDGFKVFAPAWNPGYEKNTPGWDLLMAAIARE